MKKVTLLLLSLALALSLAACGPKSTGGNSASGDTLSGETPPPETTPPATTPPATTPPATTPPATTPPATTPPATTPPATTPPATTPDEGGETGGETPSVPGIVVPGFGGFGGSGGGQEDVPVADAGELVDTLDALCRDIVEGSYTASLRSSGEFNNYFNGGVQYKEGMRVAMNHLEMAPPAHVVMLIEVPEGENAGDLAKTLADSANPRWMVCATAESVQYAEKDNLVLLVMSSPEIADAVIAAFNG